MADDVGTVLGLPYRGLSTATVPTTPSWAQGLADTGAFLSKALMAMDPAQSIPYIISQQPGPKAWLAKHPQLGDLVQNLTTLGLSRAAAPTFVGPTGKALSDEEAFLKSFNEYNPLIEKIAKNAAGKPGSMYSRDQVSDAVNDGHIISADLLKKYDGPPENFPNYLSTTLSHRFKFNPDTATDALQRTLHLTGLTTPGEEGGPELERPELATPHTLRPERATPATPETPTEVTTPPTGRPAAPGEAAPPAQAAADIIDWIKNIRTDRGGNILPTTPRKPGEDRPLVDETQTGKSQAMMRDYFLRGVPQTVLKARYRVDDARITRLINDAPHAPVNISSYFAPLEAARPGELDRRISTLPGRQQALARMYLKEGLSPTEIARRTGANRPDQRATLQKTLSEMLNKLQQQ